MSEAETAVETPPAETTTEHHDDKIKAKAALDTNFDMNDINRKRLEKDLIELKKLIATHFEQRKADEEELTQSGIAKEHLSDRIEKRKKVREEQQKVRSEREKARAEAAAAERQRRDEEEKAKAVEEDQKKKTALAAMACLGSSSRTQRTRRGDGKEKKKKILAERRKQLNIDHLNTEKLQEKAMELHKWMVTLEESKYDYETRLDAQKYDLKFMRQRVNDLMGKKTVAKKVNIRK